MVIAGGTILRRPILVIFLSFLIGIAFQYYVKIELIFLILLIFIVVLFFINKRKRQICIILIIALLGSLYLELSELNKDPLEAQEGKRCLIHGRVITLQIKSEYSFQMLIKSEDSRKRLIRVKGAMNDPAEWIGRTIEVRGTVELPDGKRNPDLFDYRLYLKTKGIRVILVSNQYQVTMEQNGTNVLTHAMARLKYRFMDELKEQMDLESFALMAGMLFGDISFLSDEVYESFQKNGIAHILSVSGIHVAIVYLYISKLLGGRKNILFYLISASLLTFYAALSEFSPSVVRSVVMIMIFMVSKITHQRYDFTCCTAASALGMLIVNPYYLFNVGFQLSYLAVFCLTVILPWTNRKIGELGEYTKNELLVKILNYLAPLVVIQIGMAPLTAYYFNYFSVISLFLNVPIIAISGFIIPVGITLIPVSYIGGILFGVGAQAAELMIDAMLWLNDFFYLPGVGFFHLVSPSEGFLFFFYTLVFFLTSEFLRILYQRKKITVIVKVSIVILITAVMVQMTTASNDEKAELIFLDVGQGDCLFLRTPNGKNILIDGGGSTYYDIGKNTLLPYLLKNKIDTVDLALVTHLHDDHFLGLAQLSKNMKIKEFGTYDANRLREEKLLSGTGLQKKNLRYLTEGDRIMLDKNIWIDILYPPELAESDYRQMFQDETDENKSSLLLKITYEDLTILMTGDLGTEGEEKILEYYKTRPDMLQSYIIKIGHHGSRYSTGDHFLRAVNPKIAVFQVGKNNFGHPHRTVIDKCLQKGIMVYRNDRDGAVILNKEDGQWHIRTMLQKNTHSNESEKN